MAWLKEAEAIAFVGLKDGDFLARVATGAIRRYYLSGQATKRATRYSEGELLDFTQRGRPLQPPSTLEPSGKVTSRNHRPVTEKIDRDLADWYRRGHQSAKQLDARVAEKYGISLATAAIIRRGLGYVPLYPGSQFLKAGGNVLCAAR